MKETHDKEVQSQILVKEKSVVVPGETLVHGMDYLPGPGTYRYGDSIYAERLGLVYVDGRALKLIPLSGKYSPKKNDVIIGKVADVTFSGWRLDTNSAYTAMLNIKDATSDFVQRGADLTQYLNLGEYVVAKIINVTSQKLIDLTLKGPGLHKLVGGRIIKVNPNKVPRIIGKQGSMVSMIKDASGCKIIVGQNGLIWLNGTPEGEVVAVEAITKVEEEAHVSGLTDRMKEYLAPYIAQRPVSPMEDESSQQQGHSSGYASSGHHSHHGSPRAGHHGHHTTEPHTEPHKESLESSEEFHEEGE